MISFANCSRYGKILVNVYFLTRLNFFSSARHCTILPIKCLIVC